VQFPTQAHIWQVGQQTGRQVCRQARHHSMEMQHMNKCCNSRELTGVVGPSSMDDVAAQQGTAGLGHNAAALYQAALSGQDGITVLGKARTCCLCNVVGGAPPSKVGVGGVHNACHLLLGQVTLHHLQPPYNTESPAALARFHQLQD